MRPSWSCHLLGVLTLLGAGTASAQDSIPRFERTACEFPLPFLYPPNLKRECGQMIVPEVRDGPNTRTFRLAVVIYPASEPDGSPPLLLIHGGPGGMGTRFMWSELAQPLTRNRDVVVYDMRGAGESEPKFCPTFDAEGSAAFEKRTRPDREAAYRAAVRSCVDSMVAEKLDRTAHGADVNALDARDLRRALGYAKWDLYAVSYGGRVAQELMRIDGAATRAVVLVSTVAAGPTYAAQFIPMYQRNLDRVFAHCAAQAACARAFPTLAQDFDALYQELSARPIEVSVGNGTSARRVWLDGDRFLMDLRRQFSTPWSIRRLPLLINEMRRGDREAAFRRLVGNGVIGSWGPLGRVVQCNEYGAQYRAAVAAELPRLRPAFRPLADDFREHCDLWLPEMKSRDNLQPVVSDAPTLVLHGEYDPMDLPATQQRITERMSHAYRFIFPGETHANPPVGCHGIVVKQFLAQPERAPDASCIAQMPEIQFKTTSGFAPTVTFAIKDASNPRSPFAGTWEATLGGGPDWTFQIDIDARTAKGSVIEQQLPIYDGVVTDSVLRFKVKSNDGAGTFTYTGRLQGDDLIFTRDAQIAPGGSMGGPGLFGGRGAARLIARRAGDAR